MNVHRFPSIVPGLLLAGAAAIASGTGRRLAAQEPDHSGEIEGVVRASGSGMPLAGASVWLVGGGARTVTHGDGAFHLTGIDVGLHHVRVERLGYRGLTVEVEVAAADPSSASLAGPPPVFVEIVMEASPIALEGMVVTAAVGEQNASEALRPVSVMAGDELQRRMTATVAGTLASLPGISATGSGPGVTQPVIRGMGGDRVLMLENGVRVSDASSSGADHATALDASSARRIEVVRGPRGLLYGGNALAGVINVISDEIPSAVPHHVTGAATGQWRSATGSGAGSAHATFALADAIPATVSVSARTSGDLQTPVGTLANTHGDLLSVDAGASRVAGWGHLGAAFRAYRYDYGIPGGFVGGHDEGVRIEMERYTTKFRAVVNDPAGALSSLRFDASYTGYEHREIEPPDILGTLFFQEAVNGDVLARHRSWGPFRGGAAGARASWELFGYGGSLSTPDTRRRSAAAYLLEEVTAGPLLIEAGARYDWVNTDPLTDDPDSDIGDIRDRSFHLLSGSLGILYHAGAGLSLGVTGARAQRTPDIGELYSEGPHLAAYSFEVGNPSLEPEVGRGVDVFVRYASDRIRGELVGFYNDIRGYIYGEETGRLSNVLLPIYQFRGQDAVFRGFEADLAVDLGGGLAMEAVASAVEGSLKNETRDALPLVPPLNGHVALKYERPAWFVRGESEMAARQDRIGEFEEPTDGYAVFNLVAGCRITVAGRLNSVTLGLHNVTNTEYRNHLSRVKTIMPEAGRGLDLTYRIVF